MHDADWKNKEQAEDEIKGLIAQYYRTYKRAKPFKPGDRVNYAGTVYDEKEMLSLADAMFDFWLGASKKAAEFERGFARYIGVRYARLVNSGSSANLLAFMALTQSSLGDRRINPGDEVITVACGFPTTVAPIIQYGAVPVFVDVTIPQYNIDCSKLEAALGPKTKAVLVAHTLGNPFDIRAVKDFCDRNGLWLVEDNCDALGSEYTMDGTTRKTGAWGDIATSSFYPPHHITMGEGGCVYTDNAELDRIVCGLRDWGRDCICPPGRDNYCGHRFDGQFGQLPLGYDHKYVYGSLGYNLKVTELQAAIGCEQLKKLPGFVERRRENWSMLRSRLEGLENKIILPEPVENGTPSWFGFLITLREEARLDRRSVVKAIESRNVQTRMLFSGNLLRHPCFDEIRGTERYRVVGGLENSDLIAKNTFWLGVYPGMDEPRINWMTDAVIDALSD